MPGQQSPEAKARENIDRMLTASGWIVQSRDEANVSAGRGVAIREFPLKSGYGEADYLLYVDGVPAGVVEAKKEGETLSGYEMASSHWRCSSVNLRSFDSCLASHAANRSLTFSRSHRDKYFDRHE